MKFSVGLPSVSGGLVDSIIKNKEYIYEGYFEAAKLATRVSKNPVRILESYVGRRYSGNILEILEPSHSIYPYVLENGKELKIVKLDEDIVTLSNEEKCQGNCSECKEKMQRKLNLQEVNIC